MTHADDYLQFVLQGLAELMETSVEDQVKQLVFEWASDHVAFLGDAELGVQDWRQYKEDAALSSAMGS